MVRVFKKGDKKKKTVNSGEIIMFDKTSFKLHTDDRVFNKKTYDYIKID